MLREIKKRRKLFKKDSISTRLKNIPYTAKILNIEPGCMFELGQGNTQGSRRGLFQTLQQDVFVHDLVNVGYKELKEPLLHFTPGKNTAVFAQ